MDELKDLVFKMATEATAREISHNQEITSWIDFSEEASDRHVAELNLRDREKEILELIIRVKNDHAEGLGKTVLKLRDKVEVVKAQAEVSEAVNKSLKSSLELVTSERKDWHDLNTNLRRENFAQRMRFKKERIMLWTFIGIQLTGAIVALIF